MLPDAYKVVVEPAHAFDDLVTSCKAATKWSVTEYNKTLNQIYQGQMRYFCWDVRIDWRTTGVGNVQVLNRSLRRYVWSKVVNRPHFEVSTPTMSFEGRYMPESQSYRVGQDINK